MMMKGFIYLTKEYNSDGSELLHFDMPKIGIGKTNNLERRHSEHHNKGSKSTTQVDFIKDWEVSDMDYVEKRIHKILKSLGFFVVNRLSHFNDRGIELSSKTEVYSGKHIDTGEELSVKLILQVLQSILSNEEFIKVELMDFQPHFLQEISICRCIDAINNGGDSIKIIAELCARFGKTLMYLELFKRLENDIMILPSYVHSVFTSFKNEIVGRYNDENIGKWKNFQGFKIIDTTSEGEENWSEKLSETLGKSKIILFVSVQTREESLNKFDIIKNISSDRKFIIVDEADFGAHTSNSKKVIDYIK